ncbi:benzoate/H(+) symporter BenE family transporter [Ancylobacter sp. 6x-1]|uniref:Benzoate/H(+) symporter BenE family transporter n=2 Tax=Ancylobacter crimeensis TaxID=2579147 RepID=A0ABT0D681_9HYPH|nr:benzoate/H(+) symporter BenE family transporter [Ancylobacter crimeensis]
MRPSIVISAVVAALVGFGGTLALIVSAAQAAGASPAEISSGVLGICLAVAATTAVLSVRYRLPIITAWTTPGAALIGASHGLTPGTLVGALLLAGVLILITATVRPLGALVQRLPVPIAAAMLAGVLFRFVTSVFTAAGAKPLLVLPLIALFLVARRLSAFGAVLIVLAAGVAYAFLLGEVKPLPDSLPLPQIVVIWPVFELQALIGVGVPLYLVTMASQNLPGFAVLRVSNYEPPTAAILAVTGFASVITAPLGALTSNLAAITASICTGPDTHPDPSKRWLAGPFYALSYILLAIGGASMVALIAAMPAELIATVAGLALIGSLVNAFGAMGDAALRFPAVITLTVTASGMSLLGIGSAFWGLVAGIVALGAEHIRRPAA